MRWIKKMACNYFDALNELYFRAKFGEDRTSCVVCRIENMVFVCLFFLSRSEACAPPFFQEGLLFQVHYTVLILVARWHHKFREIAAKDYEKSKNRRKRLCTRVHDFVQIAERCEEYSTAVV